MQQKFKHRAASYREFFTLNPSAMADGDRWDRRRRHGGRETERARSRERLRRPPLLSSRSLSVVTPSSSSLPPDHLHLPPSRSATTSDHSPPSLSSSRSLSLVTPSSSSLPLSLFISLHLDLPPPPADREISPRSTADRLPHSNSNRRISVKFVHLSRSLHPPLSLISPSSHLLSQSSSLDPPVSLVSPALSIPPSPSSLPHLSPILSPSSLPHLSPILGPSVSLPHPRSPCLSPS
ncbi:hypothetical protein ACLOJK_027542 [Asimina triloba]